MIRISKLFKTSIFVAIAMFIGTYLVKADCSLDIPESGNGHCYTVILQFEGGGSSVEYICQAVTQQNQINCYRSRNS